MLPITASARRSVFMLLASAGSVHHAARSAAAQSAPPPGHVLARVRVDAAAAVTSSARASAPDTASDAAYPLDRIAAVAPVDEAAFARTFSHRTAAVGDGTMHYVTGGRGPAVVLLHGWPEDWSSWRKVMPALAERFTVIAPDLPGLGTSSPPPSYDKRTVARLVRDLVRQLGHARAFVVGHDMGAAVAYAYAAAYPDEVPRLVFMESLVPGFGLERITDPANGGSWHFGFQGTPEYAVPLVSGRERMYLTAQVMGVTVNPEAMRAPLEEYVRAYERPTVLRAGFEYYRALIGQDARDDRAAFRGKLRMPVLAVAVTGKNAGLPDALRAVAADVRPLIVDRSGHFVQEERPVYLARRLTAFLADSAR